MYRKSIIFLLTALLMASGHVATAQEYQSTPVTVSSEKVRYNGKTCYSHVVLERQTLFSISKAYGVTVEDIYGLNPTLRETGLKKNSIILIPMVETMNTDPEKTQEKVLEEKQEVAVQEEVQKEAVKKEAKKETKAQKKRKQKTHVRKWYEDLDTIAEKYGVSVQAIMKANNLTGRKLTVRQKLIIPDPEDVIAEEEVEQAAEEAAEESPRPEENTGEVTDNATDTVHTSEADTAKALPFLFPKGKVTATLLLPFKADGTTSSRNNMDFYSGVLLAVNDLAAEGISTDLNVYDIAGGKTVTEEDIEGSDIVIGPVSSGDISRHFSIIPSGTTLISPLDPRAEKLVGMHRNMVQAPTPHEIQYRDLISWLQEDLTPADTVLMITEKGVRSDVAVQMKEIMDSQEIAYNPFSYSILEGRDVTEPMAGIMTAAGVNRIVIGSDNEAFVNDVVRNLNLLIYKKLNVVLYGTSKIRGFETIEAENFHNTSMHVSLTYYTDYEDVNVKEFLMKYRALFGTEPTQFAFQGYDIAKYFLPLAHKYGERWPEMLSESEEAMLQSTFRCMRQNDGGYVNHGIRRIIYGKDWNVMKIR